MKSLVSLSLLLFVFINAAYAAKWAVLVAGSAGYYNYRHQADNAHIYRILINNGYKPENIIVFSQNDVPNSKSNPIPNSLFNKPGNNSINYYEDYVIDYEGNDNIPANYVKVLTGDDSTGKKVLKSTEEDTIFLAFFDHGSDNLICFPYEELYSNALLKAFETMKAKKMYKRIVYYLEACHSGSMFVDLPTDSNIYGLTAANPHESSWAYYCDDEIVNHVQFDTCLGDEFSIQWMENVDEGDLTQTFKDHASVITALVKESHVSRYGDLSFENLPISEVFTGDLATVKNGKKIAQEKIEGARGDIYLNKLNYLRRRMEKTNDSQAEKEYKQELELIEKIDTYFAVLVKKFKNMGVMKVDSIEAPVKDFNCYKQSIDHSINLFGRSDYLVKYYHTLHTICDQYNEAYLYL
ncbi:hypothetical protein WA158_004554 [Blastocystis sp. Blastoise]